MQEQTAVTQLPPRPVNHVSREQQETGKSHASDSDTDQSSAEDWRKRQIRAFQRNQLKSAIQFRDDVGRVLRDKHMSRSASHQRRSKHSSHDVSTLNYATPAHVTDYTFDNPAIDCTSDVTQHDDDFEYTGGDRSRRRGDVPPIDLSSFASDSENADDDRRRRKRRRRKKRHMAQ